MNFRQPFFPPPNPLIAPKLINQIHNQKKINNSQYRTHFTLMNVYCPTTTNYQLFVAKIAQKLKQYIICDIIQISEVVDDDRVDLAIGMANDKEAMMFLMRNQDIKMDTQQHGQQTYKPIISNVFQIYINARKHLYPQMTVQIARLQPPKPVVVQSSIKIMQPEKSHYQSSYSSSRKSINSRSKSSSSSYSSLSISSSQSQNSKQKGNTQAIKGRQRKNSSQRSRSRSKARHITSKLEDTAYGFAQSVRQTVMVQQIWVFCVPLDFDEREVQIRFKQKKMYPVSSVWKMLEDMQFLQIRLDRSISIQAMNMIDLRVNHYPCVILPKLRSEIELRRQIKKYQTQLISQRPIKQQIGGVISVVKDDYDDRQRYILTFNMIGKVIRFEQRIQQILGVSIILSECQQAIRLCRIQKMFSIQNLINDYGQRIKKNELY